MNTDLAPGTWSASQSGSCYWARLRGFSGESTDLIANSYGTGTVVTVSGSDAGFESSNCGSWTKVG